MNRLDKWVGRAVLLLALGAFVLSFEKLHHVALTVGINPRLAWIYPVLVEGFTTIATLAAFLRRGRDGAWYPWFVGMLAFTYSLWANSMPESVPPQVGRAVPVVCIPLMVHMYIIIQREALAIRTELAKDELTVNDNELTDSDELDELAEYEPIPSRVGRAVNNYLEQAKAATSTEVREFWERKAAEVAA